MKREALIGASSGSAPTPEDAVGNAQLWRFVVNEIGALDEGHREVLLLRYFDGLSSAEIAQTLMVPAGTVRRRLKDSLDRLRQRLDGRRERWVARCCS
jgi:RNA polymerase sigma-70 factor (ECF subfamily)